MMNTQFTPEEIVEILAGTGTKEWNEAISTRLSQVDNYLHQDTWTKALSVYFKTVQGNAIAKILNQSLPAEGVAYLRGFAAALRLVIALPRSVEAQIEQENKKDEKKGPAPTSGY